MKTHSTKKTLSMIMALLMIITCLVSPAMASPAESTPAAVESQTATTVDADGAVSMDVSADVTAQKKVTIIVELEGETPYRQSGDLQLAAVGYDSQMAAMAKAESSIEATLNRSIEVDSRFTLLFNGFSFEGESWMIDAINKMDGFTAFEEPMFRLVEPAATGETNLTPSMSLSTGLSGATTAWDLGYTGEGMTVAIIDTGIHATHEAFSVEPENGKIDKAYLTEVFAKYGDKMHCGTDVDAVYNTAKMPFNWDYFDGDAIPNHTASEHGTHVAGIAAGNNGADFKGIAPDAQIITMQVFTNEGGGPFSSIMEALEDCVYLGVDAVNMSLGVTTWFTAYESVASTMESIYEALEDAGITVAAAAGNESVVNQSTVLGDSLSAYYNAAFSWNPDFGTINAPASFPGSLSVASMVNCNAKGGSITVEGVPFYPTPVGTNPALGELASGEYEIVYVGLCSPEEIDAAGGVEGKIALTQRGTLNFTQKCTNAAEAGAAGVILFNNKTGAFTPSVTSTIPFGYLSMEDGNALVELLPDGVHGKLILDTAHHHETILEQKFSGALENFIIYLAYERTADTSISQSADAIRYSSIISVMQKHLSEDLSVDDIAHLCHMAPSTMKYIFSKFSDCGIRKHFVRMKLAAAIPLLKNGTSVAEISKQFSFSSQNYFAQVFKAEMGVSPMEYKRNFNK